VLLQNVQTSASVFLSPDKATKLVEEKRNLSYKEIKDFFGEFQIEHTKKMREKYNDITEEEVKKVLKDGAEKARAIASAKMTDVRAKVGVSL